MRQKFPAIFCQKRDENEPKKEKKREKKGAKAKIFFFFSRGNNLHTKFFARRARAFRDSTLVREHTHAHTKTPCARRIRSKEKVRDATLSFFRARFGRISLSDQARCARRDFSSRHCLFSLFLERKKKLEEHQTHHRFGISNSREKKEETPHKTRREGNQRASPPPSRATKGTSRVFFVVPPSALFLSLLIARESWRASLGERIFRWKKKRALSLGREGGGSPSHLSKKEDKKRRQKTDCLGYQTDTKIFLGFSCKKGRDGTN